MGVMRENTSKKYERAREHVKAVKGFYNHLIIYIIVNIIVQLFYSGVFDGGEFTSYIPYWVRFTTPFFWGISLCIHGLIVFQGRYFKRLWKNWEEKKIKEIMEEEEQLGSKWK